MSARHLSAWTRPGQCDRRRERRPGAGSQTAGRRRNTTSGRDGRVRGDGHVSGDAIPQARPGARRVERLIWAATRAPSPGNSQGWDFVLVDDAYKVSHRPRRAGRRRRTGGGDVPSGSHHPVDARWHGEAVDTLDQAPRSSSSPAAIYPPGAPREQFVVALYPAAQNILLGSTGSRSGAMFTTLHNSSEPTVREVLGLPETTKMTTPRRLTAASFGPVKRRPDDFTTTGKATKVPLRHLSAIASNRYASGRAMLAP